MPIVPNPSEHQSADGDAILTLVDELWADRDALDLDTINGNFIGATRGEISLRRRRG